MNKKDAGSSLKQKNQIDIQSVEKLSGILDLNFNKDGNYSKKVPISIIWIINIYV